jgi:hypothetical protein
MTLELWIAPAVLGLLYVLALVVGRHHANHPPEPITRFTRPERRALSDEERNDRFMLIGYTVIMLPILMISFCIVGAWLLRHIL